MEEKIAIFIYCYAVNDWKERLERQLSRLRTSGLYDAAQIIQLAVTDVSISKLEEVNQVLSDYSKINLHFTGKNWFEATTLNMLDTFVRSHEDEYKVMYFHVKGVHNKYKNFQTQEFFPLKTKGIDCWVEMLEFFLIDKWQECISLLNDYDTVGVTNNGNWWWGNFWWTKSSYVKSIMELNKYFSGVRWSAEAWLHDAHPNKNEIKYFEMFKFMHDPYYTVIPTYFYDGTNLKDLNINVLKAEYGYFAEQRDEGRGLLKLDNQTIDVTDLVKEHVAQTNNKNFSFFSESFPYFSYERFCGTDPAFNQTKLMRVWFSTNFEPEKEYVISSFLDFPIKLGYFGEE